MFSVSCNYTKHLTQNQTLLNENKLSLHTPKPIKYKGETESVLLSLAYPTANTHVFDLGFMPKYKLWRYNNNYTKYKADSLHPKIIKHKVEPPSLLDSNMLDRSRGLMQLYMENLGYFYSKVNFEVIPKGRKKVDVVYKIESGKNYTIRKVNYFSTQQDIQWLLETSSSESELIPGEPYTKIKCGIERERLYKIIRNAGYYDFKSDNISFLIDTSNKARVKSLLDDPFNQAVTYAPIPENQTIDVNLNVLRTRDSTFSQLYTIHKVVVTIINPQDDLEKLLGWTESELDQVYFKYKLLPVNRKVITRNVLIHQGDIYNTVDFEATINRLNQLGIFQFVNIQYEKAEGFIGKLNCNINLNISPKYDLVGLTDVSTSDEDYLLGTGFGLTFQNRNLFHGANLLALRTSYSTEFRNDAFLTGTKKFYQSGNNVNLSANLTAPKFILPINQNLFSKKNMPYTLLGASYSFMSRIANYTIINVTGNFGYTWQETQFKHWRVNPIFLTVTQVPEKYLGDDFKKKLESNAYLRNTFTSAVIQGENLIFDYRSKPKRKYASFSSMRIGFEEAGSLLTGIDKLYSGLGGSNIANIASYVKGDIDLRHYINRRKSQWVNRVMMGAGLPFRESTTLPYIKQFAAGGPFSNRGWRSRALGPGRSVDTTYQSGNSIIDRTGDMKFELNTEYRFNILKLFSGAINLKGAAFADIGNIWLMNKNNDVEGGEFDPKYFVRDLAVSTGLGARFDFSFFVFRVDVGFPIKQPQISSNYGFVIDKMKFSSGLWNLALGYPF
ncbi:MAG: BamA/TamA family outer membrane protein [Bacteroidetes bacterium]|nr:BamA/TamA family outer membrane protein [Bacteroidota bacterium]